jgi:K+/H+ antiporter YhaU regulatory subunit KhtT
MGEIIDYDYYGSTKIRDGYTKIYDYVTQRLYYFDNHPDEPISQLEIEDIYDLCFDLLYYLDQYKEIKEQLNEAIDFIKNDCYTVLSEYKFIDDIPEKGILALGTRTTKRRKIRVEVSLMYRDMEKAKARMERELKNKQLILVENPDPEYYIKAKDYITELIKLDIFRKDDLYDKVFKSTTYFGDYNKLYRKYKAFQDKVIPILHKLEDEEKELNKKQKALDEEKNALLKKLKRKTKGLETLQKTLDDKQKVLDKEMADFKIRQAENKKYWKYSREN